MRLPRLAMLLGYVASSACSALPSERLLVRATIPTDEADGATSEMVIVERDGSFAVCDLLLGTCVPLVARESAELEALDVSEDAALRLVELGGVLLERALAEEVSDSTGCAPYVALGVAVAAFGAWRISRSTIARDLRGRVHARIYDAHAAVRVATANTRVAFEESIVSRAHLLKRPGDDEVVLRAALVRAAGALLTEGERAFAAGARSALRSSDDVLVIGDQTYFRVRIGAEFRLLEVSYADMRTVRQYGEWMDLDRLLDGARTHLGSNGSIDMTARALRAVVLAAFAVLPFIQTDVARSAGLC